MSSILSKLYNGEIYPAENVLPKNPRYRQICSKEAKLEEELKSELNDGQKDLYNKMLDERIERVHMEDIQLFVDAFRLGAGIMIEILCDSYD